MKFIVFDLGGTLSDHGQRLHLLPPAEKFRDPNAWTEYTKACEHDLPIRDNIDLVNVVRAGAGTGTMVMVLTSRNEIARACTERWLLDHGCVGYDFLVMRGQNDTRTDIEFKTAKLKELGLYNIRCCFDDSPHMVEHIRALGVTCHQVAPINAEYYKSVHDAQS